MTCFEITSRGIAAKTIREKGLFIALSRCPAALPSDEAIPRVHRRRLLRQKAPRNDTCPKSDIYLAEAGDLTRGNFRVIICLS
jgi:hypothetical protein